LPYAIVCSPEPPRRFQARSVRDTGRSVARYFSGQMSRPGGAWPSSLRGGLPGISPHPRSPGVPWVWHDAPLRVFLLQRIGTPHTLYLFQKYDTATACCAAMTEGVPFSTTHATELSKFLFGAAVEAAGRVRHRVVGQQRLSNPLVPTRANLSQTAFATGSI
jgi:hypothetical protein